MRLKANLTHRVKPSYIAESEKKYMDKSVLEHEPALALLKTMVLRFIKKFVAS